MSVCAGSTLVCNFKDTALLLAEEKLFALEDEVTIIPKFSSDEPVECIKTKFGPFTAGTATSVPLWAAIALEKKRLCTIEAPHWLHEEELKQMRDDEKAAGPNQFAKVPDHYLELACAFLHTQTFCPDARSHQRLNLLLRQILELRRGKLYKGLKELAVRPELYVLTGITSCELHCIRTRSLNTLDEFTKLLGIYRGLSQADGAGGDSFEESTSTHEEDSSSHQLY